MREIIVDSFAGGGGASTGIEIALGVSPDIAINHDAVALNMHQANHPDTRHLPHSIWKVDPLEVCAGRPVGLFWASPDCKHFSKAKGGKPVERSIRDLAWVVVRWAKQVSPRVIMLENVEEFQTWGPLGVDDKPCQVRKGDTFRKWVGELKRLGYKVEHRELRACDFGAPTIRKRLFLIARRDGELIVWPKPTHGDPKSDAVKSGKLLPWRTAAEIIDWSLPCPSIFDTSAEIMVKYGLRAVRPLQEATMARIAKGVKRYVLDAAKPFIVNLTHHGAERTESIDDPMMTITGAHRGEKAIVTPFISAAQHGGSVRSIDEPHHTVTASNKDQNQIIAPHVMTMRNAQKPFNGADEPTHTITSGGAHMHLVAAFLAKHFGGHESPGWPADKPISTVTAADHHSLVAANLFRQFGTAVGSSLEEPARTVMTDGAGGKSGLSAAFLQKYYGVDQDPRLEGPLHTVTTKHRFGLATVTIEGEPYFITDIGMRMLSPRELFRAQGFSDTYIIDRGADGKPITKTDQVSKCGNSVCPPMAAALVAANFAPAGCWRIGRSRFLLGSRRMTNPGATPMTERDEMVALAEKLDLLALDFEASGSIRRLMNKAADALRSAARTDAGYGAGLREQATALWAKLCTDCVHSSTEKCDCLDDILAAFSEIAARTDADVAVTLVWNEYLREGDVDEWDAETVFGTFYGVKRHAFCFMPSHDSSPIQNQGQQSSEEAKAVCQADYERRIRSAIAALPAPGGITPVPQLEPWRDEISEIIGHLGSAIVQSTSSDDQIIMDHVKAAHEIAKIVRRKA